ncbi:MAG: ABC transporter ATP-binding protein [Desulfurococcales archaeon]|nr:ABC transporter ATP-binding protein [Desulfurococcales archaeon]MCE4605227.1 ABC transporter ATP-binding protein [Desulfurococcales archaeon]
MAPILEVDGIDAGYGKLQILFNVSMEVEPKDIFVIVGPNGSGKSTLLKTIFGLTKIYKGSIKFEGEEITGKPPHDIAKTGVAYLPQTDNIFAQLTVMENLKMAAYTLPSDLAEERISEVLDRFSLLKARLKDKAMTLSGGQRQILAMAMSLIRKPKLMLFDEPTAALAPKLAAEILKEIIKLRDELGITIILVEQNAKKALQMGDKALLLVGGRVMYRGQARELLEHPELGTLYLGLKK